MTRSRRARQYPQTVTFQRAGDGIDPSAVPSFRLASGAVIPGIGLGTFGSDKYGAPEISTAVLGALEAGYRHIDCATVYGNEREIGDSLSAALIGGVGREELWITSKLWNDE